MALTPCRECDQPIAASAATCPNCGVASPAGQCRLIIRRPGRLTTGVPLAVEVDREPIADLRGGNNEVSMLIAPGRHQVAAKLLARATKASQAEFDVRSGTTTITITTSKFNGAPKFEIT